MLKYDYIVKCHINSKYVKKYCIFDDAKNYGVMGETAFLRFKKVLKLDDKKVLYLNATKMSFLNMLNEF